MVLPEHGRILPRPDTGGTVTIKLPAEATDGAVTVWESRRASGDTRGPGLHTHPGFDELFYVLSGEYQFTAAGERFIAPTGTLVCIPRGVFHTFASTGAEEGRLLSFGVPGGIEDFFEEMMFAEDGSRATTVGGKHGVVFAKPDPDPDRP